MVIRSLLPMSLETVHDPKEHVLLIALRFMRHATLRLSVIMFLICVCWHLERLCRALSLGSILNLLNPKCCPEPKAPWQ